MSKPLFRLAARLLIASALAFVAPTSSGAQTSNCCFTLRIGPTGGQVAAVLVGAAVVIGVGTYFLARAPRLTGCVVREGGGLVLQRSGPGDSLYLLEGQTTALQPGERVKVIGRKHRNGNHQQVVRVSRVAKEYGPCSAVAGVLPPVPVGP